MVDYIDVLITGSRVESYSRKGHERGCVLPLLSSVPGILINGSQTSFGYLLWACVLLALVKMLPSQCSLVFVDER